MRRNSAWPDLPQDPMDLVLLRLRQQDGLRALASFRLVCKAWLAAFQRHPGTAFRQLKEPDDLSRLSKMMPSMAKLCVSSPPRYNYVDNASDCEKLRQFELTGSLKCQYRYGLPSSLSFPIDFSSLPSKLMDLRIINAMPEAASLSSCGSLDLTRLGLWDSKLHLDDAPPSLVDLLQCLPGLQARAS